jgi:hypothetical protein
MEQLQVEAIARMGLLMLLQQEKLARRVRDAWYAPETWKRAGTVQQSHLATQVQPMVLQMRLSSRLSLKA